MSISASITVTIPVSERGHAARDRVVAEFKDLSGVYIDVFSIKELSDELENNVEGGRARCETVAKRAALKPITDVNYGLHGNKDGPLSMWFQIRAEQ